MKIIYSLLITVFAISIANAQYVTIPDSNFAAWLNSECHSAMNGNQMDTTSPAVTSLTYIELHSLISDLTGIQYFDSLKNLNCANIHLEYIPKLPNSLRSIFCGNNQLTTLPNLPSSLKFLYCPYNQLVSLPPLPDSLVVLSCYNNQLTSLPILPNKLHELFCFNNQLISLPTLPDSIWKINCSYNYLNTLSALPSSLSELNCSYNLLTNLPLLPSSLKDLYTSNNLLITIPALPDSLMDLYCHHNNITSIPSLPITLRMLDCQKNQLTSLPVLPNSLSLLYCDTNNLTSLPVLPSSLTNLKCDHNQLNSLPNLPSSLYQFECSYNNIACFPKFPTSLTDNQYFNISNNPFTCLPNYVSAMDYTTLSYPLCIIGDTINNLNFCDGAQGILGYIYKDNNLNCIKDSGDISLSNIHEMIYNNNNILLGHTFSTVNGIYNFSAPIGSYVVRVDTTNLPLIINCLSPGVDSAITLNFANSLVTDINFGFSCNPGFDIGVRSILPLGTVFPGQIHRLKIWAGDMNQWYSSIISCANGTSGQITIEVSGPVTYHGITSGAMTPVITGNVYTYNIADFGTINNNIAFGLMFKTDTTAQAGDTICVHVVTSSTSGDNNTFNNIKHFCYAVVNSFDPNIKEVYPVNISTDFQDYLTYTIHFQNTGTAPAMNIRIVDTLSNNLDLSTFQVMNYSHYNITSLAGNKLRINFPNIQLPDSTTNEEASKGFIQYRIKPKENLVLGTQILNRANIYFDYNLPVVTNTTINEYTHTYIISQNIKNSIKIYPNPTQDYLTVLTDIEGEKMINISTVDGRKIIEYISDKNENTIDISNLSKNIYIISVKTNENTAYSKFCKY